MQGRVVATHQSPHDALGGRQPHARPHQQVLDLGQGDQRRVPDGTRHCILQRVGKPFGLQGN